jgi:hypothetical protein
MPPIDPTYAILRSSQVEPGVKTLTPNREGVPVDNQRSTPASHQSRQDRLVRERVHDPYMSKSKLPEPTVCLQCHAVYHQGRWVWAPRPAAALEEMCPACLRIRDQYPAGFLTLSGPYLQEHKSEIINLARNEEATETAEHALHRIMALEEHADQLIITTTDIHLPRRIGDALHRAHRGKLDFHYEEEGSRLRVFWQR